MDGLALAEAIEALRIITTEQTAAIKSLTEASRTAAMCVDTLRSRIEALENGRVACE